MQDLQISEAIWADLLSARAAHLPVSSDISTAHRLYGPLVGAAGRFVLAQVGQSLDGRVATVSGDARDVSGPEGLRHLHRCRACVDAVIVGCGTVLSDNPRLTVREVTGPDPVRVIIDRNGALDGTQRLFHEGSSPVLLMTGNDCPERAIDGAEVIRLPVGPGGLSPADILAILSARGLERVLVEGGARTIARFLEAGLVDRLHLSIAPLIIGSGRPGFRLSPIDRLSQALRPSFETYALGRDILFDCDLRQEGLPPV